MLTHAKVKALKTPGRYGDGGGLYLNVAKSGSKSWVQRIAIDGRRRDVGLGGFPAVSLAKAREQASQNRNAIADGRDPVAEKRTPKPAMPTFREAARSCHEMTRPRWRNEKHAANWLATLERHAIEEDNTPRLDGVLTGLLRDTGKYTEERLDELAGRIVDLARRRGGR